MIFSGDWKSAQSQAEPTRAAQRKTEAPRRRAGQETEKTAYEERRDAHDDGYRIR